MVIWHLLMLPLQKPKSSMSWLPRAYIFYTLQHCFFFSFHKRHDLKMYPKKAPADPDNTQLHLKSSCLLSPTIYELNRMAHQAEMVFHNSVTTSSTSIGYIL
mmetsp:Transcript_29841/g.51824  ORF Transcript_29841/g.51824 Transcript_29841/m.51824 type:complete len:102 (+) Transcript_29841:202-507(+)